MSDAPWSPMSNTEAVADARRFAANERARVAVERWEQDCPVRYRDVSLTSVWANPAFAAARRDIELWLADPTRDLVFAGGVGVGKTYTALALSRVLATRGFIPAFVRLARLFDAAGPNGDADLVRRARTAGVLVVDDVAAHRVNLTEFQANVLDIVLSERVDNLRPTIYTTNMRAAGLAAYLGPRFHSRLRLAVVLEIDADAPDLRAVEGV